MLVLSVSVVFLSLPVLTLPTHPLSFIRSQVLVCQLPPTTVSADFPTWLDHVLTSHAQTARGKPDAFVLPECFLDAYSPHADLEKNERLAALAKVVRLYDVVLY